MSFYHRPGDSGGCFSRGGRTLHLTHTKFITREGAGLSGAWISWVFDRGFEFAWHIWPLQMYIRIMSIHGRLGYRSPIYVEFWNLTKMDRERREFYWDTDGFGFDTAGRRQYLQSEVDKINGHPTSN